MKSPEAAICPASILSLDMAMTDAEDNGPTLVQKAALTEKAEPWSGEGAVEAN